LRAVKRRIDGVYGQRHRLLLREIAGKGPPNHGDVNIATGHGIEDRGRWVRAAVIAVQHVAADIGDDAAARKGVRGRRIQW
jgi:hypothetical protein